ncbi:putative malate/L-lactate dehydrogenase (plasmid) [Alkalihalophilus pseudofirmus OF4]|uniref:Malate/L-lactate dehydrogenase n=1 Tax=Alkalihalophilus pseudofirmus (strain ATCC BAA-2126 / JCM 17055 / OF4) TaxID=398511 RepID=D3G1S2_ALKPO|nr:MULTISPECIES: Ldh family oxidoreductase [Alkalihalophilus]ADC52298.1 putative malate/L-lactate dehydrogenase [Alkalihalophilus pseudofirmus OF4]MED1603307.1 Ldh family oxidoreductase [Alkalihalophilus marmarensis]
MEFQANYLESYVSDVLQAVGLKKENGDIVAESLVSANLRGVDSHGVTRLPIYVQRIRSGAVTPNPDVKVIEESDSTLLIDGDDGMGQIVGKKTIELGIEKAKKNGAVYIGVKRSSHFGIGAYFIQQAVKHDLIAYAMSNAPSTMAPFGGIKPYLGTNPFAFGVPAGKHEPIIFDMATSVVARGKIISAEQRGDDIPEGWAIDSKGRSTTNAKEALEGTVLPFAGPKGYAISLMVDIMSGVLTGAGFGPHINNIYGDFDKSQNVGHFFQLIDVNRFMPAESFKNRVDQMIDEIKTSPKAEGVEEIFLPGEIEFNTEKERLSRGINLGKEVYESIKLVGKEARVNIEDYQKVTQN